MHASQPGGASVDLLVVAGPDAGQRFTFDAREGVIGSAPPEGVSGSIRLSDPSIARQQARLSWDGADLVLQHLDGATLPTRINGVVRGHAVLVPGDRIQVGRVVLEVCTHEGTSLAGLLQPVEAAPSPRSPRAAQPGFPDEEDACTTVVRPIPLAPEPVRAHLTVLQGQHALGERIFELRADVTAIGRGKGSQIEVRDRGVSRQHAELAFEGGALILVQKSPANFTFVNGERVVDSRVLRDGDKIQIADVALLEVGGLAKGSARSGSSFGGLSHAMEERLRLERRIEAEFLRRGSMLDVDVAGSAEMKQPGTDPAHIILSFERFRDYVANTVKEFQGVVLNSNGDELMCFFEDTYSAVRAGSAVLQRLPDFNRRENLLPRPFRFRIGIHTGDCLVDLVNGRAFSPLVDTAGHLQKQAEVNGMLISHDTLLALPEGLPFEPAGELPRGAIATYRLTRFV
jgi:pSer/pThr/pTyr-binding forkhead associated (FHA) protein/class 3 adenylate cyclase